MLKNIIISVITLLFSNVVSAAQVSWTPIFNPTLEYDDNVLMRDDNKEGSFIFSVQPTINAEYKTETFSLGTQFGYKFARYNQLSRLNESEPFIQINSIKTDARSTLQLNLAYSEDLSRNTASEDSGNFDSDTLITARSVTPSYSYNLTERDTVSLSASYSDREYSTNEFSDNNTKSLSASWNRNVTERLMLGLASTATFYQSGTNTLGTENDIYGLSLTSEYALSESWLLSGQAGINYIDSTSKTLARPTNTSNTGSIFNISINRKLQTQTLSIDISRSLNPSSSGEVNKQDVFQTRWTKTLNEKLSFSLAGSYLETTDAFGNESNKREYISIQPSFNWNFAENTTIKLSYSYKQQQDNLSSKAESNSVLFGIKHDFGSY
jgi:hypothetical protein